MIAAGRLLPRSLVLKRSATCLQHSRLFSDSAKPNEAEDDRNLHNPLLKDDIPYEVEGEVVEEEAKTDLTATYVRPFSSSSRAMVSFNELINVLAKAYRWIGPNGNIHYLRDMSTVTKAEEPVVSRKYLSREESAASFSKSPMQRGHAADMMRLRKAKEDLGNYQVTPKEKIKQAYRPTTLDGYGGIVEARILEAMDNFKPPGPSVQLSYLNQGGNPYIDEATSRMHRMMKENGCLPQWIELHKEIGADTELFRAGLKDAHTAWRAEGGAHGLFKSSKRWSQLDEYMNSKLKEINKKILHFNLIAPSIHLQKRALILSHEVENVED